MLPTDFMNDKALKTLEYDKIISRLETYASSPMGKKCCTTLLPSSDYNEIITAQEETRDALSRLYKTGFLSFQGLTDIRPHLRLLDIDSTLTAGELLEIARLLSITAQVKEFGDTEEETMAFDSLHPYFDLSRWNFFTRESPPAFCPPMKSVMMHPLPSGTSAKKLSRPISPSITNWLPLLILRVTAPFYRTL